MELAGRQGFELGAGPVSNVAMARDFWFKRLRHRRLRRFVSFTAVHSRPCSSARRGDILETEKFGHFKLLKEHSQPREELAHAPSGQQLDGESTRAGAERLSFRRHCRSHFFLQRLTVIPFPGASKLTGRGTPGPATAKRTSSPTQSMMPRVIVPLAAPLRFR